MESVVFRLSREVMLLLWGIAKERVDLKRGTPAFDKNHTYGTNTEYIANFIGLMGEYAFGLFIRQEPDLQNHMAGDRGFDFIVNQQTIDVKTAFGDELIFHFDEFRADIAIAARVYRLPNGKISPRVGLNGWIKKLYFATHCGIKNYGYGDRHYIPPTELRPMEELEPQTRIMLY